MFVAIFLSISFKGCISLISVLNLSKLNLMPNLLQNIGQIIAKIFSILMGCLKNDKFWDLQFLVCKFVYIQGFKKKQAGAELCQAHCSLPTASLAIH